MIKSILHKWNLSLCLFYIYILFAYKKSCNENPCSYILNHSSKQVYMKNSQKKQLIDHTSFIPAYLGAKPLEHAYLKIWNASSNSLQKIILTYLNSIWMLNPYNYKHQVSLQFLTFAKKTKGETPIFILICISFIISAVWHLFKCLLAILHLLYLTIWQLSVPPHPVLFLFRKFLLC